jgi:hypothetical protein
MTDTKTLTKSDLAQFTGTENWYRHGMVRDVLYTDGVRYVAQTAGAYWLIDEIAFGQRGNKRVAAEGFQLWKLKVNPDHTARLACEDGNGGVVFRTGRRDRPPSGGLFLRPPLGGKPRRLRTRPPGIPFFFAGPQQPHHISQTAPPPGSARSWLHRLENSAPAPQPSCATISGGSTAILCRARPCNFQPHGSTAAANWIRSRPPSSAHL